MDIFKRPKFGPRPVGYVPGIGRGAVAFFTRSDVGAADPNMNPTFNTRGHEHDKEEVPESLFDKWMGYSEPKTSKKVEKEDLEADEIYAKIEDYMDERHKRAKNFSARPPDKKINAGALMTDLKPDLITVTKGVVYIDQWESLPESKSIVKKKKKKLNYQPVSDSTIISAYNDSFAVPNAKEKMISSSIAKSNNASFASVDPEGYLTHLDILDSSNQEVKDLKKLRSMFRSLLNTNPSQEKVWLALSRLEEKAGNLKAAKDLLREACSACPESEDIWTEYARLNPSDRLVLQKASECLPKSVKIWLLIVSKQPTKELKFSQLKKALELNPESVKLWKELVSICSESEAKKYLEKAVICASHSLDLWLALAKLQGYKEARKTLNEARKHLPYEPGIWIAAAKLEEASGNTENVPELIKRGIKTLTNAAVDIDRKLWIDEAVVSDKSGSVVTAKAILRFTLTSGLTDENKRKTWLDDFNRIEKEAGLEVCRFFYQAVLQEDPGFKAMWKNAIRIEGGDLEVIRAACAKVETSDKLKKQLIQKTGKEETAGLIDKVLSGWGGDKVKLEVYKKALFWEQLDLAENLLSGIWKNSEKFGVKTVGFYVKTGNTEKAKETQLRVLETFGGSLSYKYVGVIFPYEESKKILTTAVQKFQTESRVWIYLAEVEKAAGNLLKTRYILEQGRNNSKDSDVFVKSIEFEMETNSKTAELICNIALQRFKEVGKIWALSIELAAKKEKKSKIAEAFEHCNNDVDLFLVIARLFCSERKIEKARIWFEKALKMNEKVGDVWIYYFEMEKKTGEEERAEKIGKKIDEVCVSKGKLWKKTAKKTGLKKNSEILNEAFKGLAKLL